MDKGLYCLVFRNDSCCLGVGALGTLTFQPGWHVYCGSALGPGGLARVRRHIRLFQEKDKSPRWHIDYLLEHPGFSLTGAVCAHTIERAECRVAGALGGIPLRGFGCSDCRCISHLFFFSQDPSLSVRAAFQSQGFLPIIKTIKSSKDHS